LIDKKKIQSLISGIEVIQVASSQIVDIINRRAKRVDSFNNEDDNTMALESLAINLCHFYESLESMFTRIAKTVDGSMPSGGSWHDELLQQLLSDFMQTRMPVLSMETYRAIKEYKDFRHKSYKDFAIKYDWDNMKKLVVSASGVLDMVNGDLARFKKYLADSIEN
jgi:hypothetical protein